MRRSESLRKSVWILWVIVIILLLINVGLLYALNVARLTAVESLAKAEAMLEKLSQEVVVYNVPINQSIPVKADVPLNQTLQVPINTVIPIDQQMKVPLKTLAGDVMLDVPVKTDVAIDTVVPVDFNDTIRVDTSVELNTTVPVEIAVGRTSLAGYVKQARLDVAQLKYYLSLGSEPVVEDLPDLPESANDEAQSSLTDVPIAAVATEASTAEDVNPLAATEEAESAELLAQAGHNNQLATSLGLCGHPYWPLQPGTTWTYNSASTSYTERVDTVLDDQVTLTTQYAGQDIQFNLNCTSEGLGDAYLGDMRRLTELGKLTFDNPQGVFLSKPELLEKIGSTWSQEVDVKGTLEGQHGSSLVLGRISRGRAVATYSVAGSETIETPLGPKDALRVEQKIDLSLDIDFELGEQVIPATEVAQLNNSYWFVKGLGLARMHWQGGTIKQSFEFGQTPIEQQSDLSALDQDQLVFVCVALEGKSLECKRIGGVTQTDLTISSTSEWQVPQFVFPVGATAIGDGGNGPTNSGSTTPETSDPESKSPSGPNLDDGQQSNNPPVSDNPQNEQTQLLAYAQAVNELGEQMSDSAQDFGETALKYRDDQVSLEEFHRKFDEFNPKVKQFVRSINGLNPPPKALTIHQKLTSGLAKCDQAMNLLNTWFNTFDSGLKETGAILVAECTEEVTEAGNELSVLTGVNLPSQ
jgi:hypothetical protein